MYKKCLGIASYSCVSFTMQSDTLTLLPFGLYTLELMNNSFLSSELSSHPGNRVTSKILSETFNNCDQSRKILFTFIEFLVITNVHCFLDLMNRHSKHLVPVALFPPLVVHTRIPHFRIRHDLVSAFTFQNETPLQTPVVIDIGV